jgi:NitT/TauT family transport system substrate-binding protein
MNRSKSLLLWIVLFSAVWSGIACQREQPQQQQAPQQQSVRRVTVNQAFEHLLYIGLYVAKDTGFFQQQGLDVQIDTGGGDAQAFAALTSGAAQFAQGDPAFVAIANEQGWQGRVVAMAVDRVAMWGVTFDKTIKPFSDPKGFARRTVATYPDPNTSYVVQKQLTQRAGLTLGKDTRIVQVPFGTELATLRNKKADIAHTIEPNASQVEIEGGSVVFSYPEAWGPLAFTGVMTSADLIARDPDLVQRFMNAYEQAFQLIHSDRPRALDIAAKRLPSLDRQLIERALNRLIASGSLPQHVAVDPESWRKLLEIRVQVGDLKSMPSARLIENRFAEAAMKAR